MTFEELQLCGPA